MDASEIMFVSLNKKMTKDKMKTENIKIKANSKYIKQIL